MKEAIIVEGRYDKIKLSSVIDGLIIETHGFRIFKDKKQMEFIRKLADTRGILIMTDSDSAGFVIRNYLAGAIDPAKIKHAYIPDLVGKEKRKSQPSKEGKLGVEGVPVEEIYKALQRAGVICNDKKSDLSTKEAVTSVDLFEAGLSGGIDSATKRKKFLQSLGLPEYLSQKALLKVLLDTMEREEFFRKVEEILN